MGSRQSVTTVGTGSNVQAADFLDITTTGINGKSAGRNFVHNGDFRISQRTAGLGVTTSGYYGPDRWYSEISNFPLSILQSTVLTFLPKAVM